MIGERMLLSNFNLLATAPGGVARLRELILTLAVQGKLVPQDAADEPAAVLLEKIRAEKDRLIGEGKIRRDKPLAGISVQKMPFELPSGWCWTRVSEICTLVTDGEHATPERCDDTKAIPLVTAKNVRHEVMDYRVTDFVPLEIAKKCWERCKPAVGDILMVSVGATLGRLCVLRDAVDMVLVRSVTVLRPAQSGVMPDFLARHLMAPNTQLEIWREVKQSAQPCLYLAKSAGLAIALPPLAEQSRIVTRVEELMHLCDALEAKGKLEAAQHAQLVSSLLATLTDSETPEALAANWQRISQHFDLLLDRPEAVDALEQTILQLAVRGLLVPQNPQDEPASVLLQQIRAEKDGLIAAGKIKRDKPLAEISEEERPFALPRRWEWVRLGKAAKKITDGTHHSPANFPTGDFMYLSAKNIKSWGIDLSSATFISKAVHDEIYARCDPEFGDILYIKDGATTGVLTVNTIREPFSLLSSVGVIKPSCGLTSDYLALVLQSPFFYQAMRDGMSGVAITRVTLSKLGDAKLPLPPLAEQSRIVTQVNTLRRLCADLRQRLAASQNTQSQLAAALLEAPAA